jgi:hypothetical protein
MNQEAGYNYLDTSYTGTSSSYLSGLGDNDVYNVFKIISSNDIGVARSTTAGELGPFI